MGVEHDWGDRLPTLTGARLELRSLEDTDVPALFSIFSDPEVTRFWSWVPYVVEFEAARLLEEIRGHFRARRLFQWGIARRSDGLVIGTTTLFDWSAPHRRAAIGYALGRAHWGQGLAAEAVTTLVRFAFDTLDLHRLEAGADPRNQRSLRLLEGLGFEREGLLRERYHVGTENQDDVIYGLLRSEWRRPGG